MINQKLTHSNSVFKKFPTAARSMVAIACLVALSACSSDSDDSTVEDDSGTVDGSMAPDGSTNPDDSMGSVDSRSLAFVAMRSSDWTSGRIDRISLDEGNIITGSYPATDSSDIRSTTDGINVYQIGRSGLNSITRFDPIDTSAVDYQISVNDDNPASANPYSLTFLNETKAYLTRYGSDELWIVDPRGETEGSFKTGSIDLSVYDLDEPNMSDAILVGDKLFVLMERLTEFSVLKSAYIAVIDTTTDTEIVTNTDEGALPGIELEVRNPTALQYNASSNEIFVVGRGAYFADDLVTEDTYSGGIEIIDPDTYETDLLIDDGTETDNEGGYFFDGLVINDNLGYLLIYAGWQDTTLRTFNPTSGLLYPELVEGMQSVDITTLVHGPDNHLWIGINGEQIGFKRLDLATGIIADEIVATELVPMDLTFIDVAAE